MKNLYPSDKIYIKESIVAKGERGVFASRDIKKGEIIEECPIIEVQEEDPSNSREGILTTYFFYYGKKKSGQAIALGFGSIYNHTDESNAVCKIKQDEGLIEFTARKDILKDQEITVNYNFDDPNSKTPLWFDA